MPELSLTSKSWLVASDIITPHPTTFLDHTHPVPSEPSSSSPGNCRELAAVMSYSWGPCSHLRPS